MFFGQSNDYIGFWQEIREFGTICHLANLKTRDLAIYLNRVSGLYIPQELLI